MIDNNCSPFASLEKFKITLENIFIYLHQAIVPLCMELPTVIVHVEFFPCAEASKMLVQCNLVCAQD